MWEKAGARQASIDWRRFLQEYVDKTEETNHPCRLSFLLALNSPTGGVCTSERSVEAGRSEVRCTFCKDEYLVLKEAPCEVRIGILRNGG
jgi:hypothetical protein